MVSHSTLSLSDPLELDEERELDESFGRLLEGRAPGSGVGLPLERSGLISRPCPSDELTSPNPPPPALGWSRFGPDCFTG